MGRTSLIKNNVEDMANVVRLQQWGAIALSEYSVKG